ncbi:MAG: DUF1579 family protein [Planctomycetota bacterium]
MSSPLRQATLLLLLFALAAGAEEPAKEVSRSLKDFIKDRNLGEADSEPFIKAVSKCKGMKVEWELRVFNVEETGDGFETPDAKTSKFRECVIFMLQSLAPGTQAKDIPHDQFILVRCLKGLGKGDERLEVGKKYYVEGTLWGATGGNWRTIFLHDYTIQPGGRPTTNEGVNPGPEHEVMAKWSGSWDRAIRIWMKPGGKPFEMTSSAEIRMVMEGRFSRMTASSDMGGTKYSGESTIGYDPATKKWSIYAIDNMGPAATHLEGTSADGGKTIEFKGMMIEATNGSEIHTRWVQTEKGPDEILMEMYTGEGKDEVKKMEIASRRKK